MWPTWSTAPVDRASATSCSASASVPAIGFSTSVEMPRARKAPATSRCKDRRHGDRDGVHRDRGARGSRTGPPSGSCAATAAARSALASATPTSRTPGIVDEDPGVMLAEMPDPDDAHSQWLHACAFLQRSRARPCLPRCCASMNSSRCFTSGQRCPWDSRISGGVRGGHLRPVDQAVRLVQRRDRLGRDAVAPQADDVDAADLRGIAVDDHVAGHVVVDPRQAAHVAELAERHERVHADAAGDRHVRLDVRRGRPASCCWR